MSEETVRPRTFSNPEPWQQDEVRRSFQFPAGFPAVSRSPLGRAVIDSENGSARHSRASSIVSTRTKVSINTLQEDARSARSVDVVVGNQSFRIARDGSRVTSSSLHDNLPPYSPNAPSTFLQDDMISVLSGHSGSINESVVSEEHRQRSLSDADADAYASDATETAEIQDRHGPRAYQFNGHGSSLGNFARINHRESSSSDEVSTPLSSNTPVSDAETPRAVPPSPTQTDPSPTIQRQSSWLFSTISHLFGGNNSTVKGQQIVPVDSPTEASPVANVPVLRSSLEAFPKFEDAPQQAIKNGPHLPQPQSSDTSSISQTSNSTSTFSASSSSNLRTSSHPSSTSATTISSRSVDMPPPPTPPKPSTYQPQPPSLPDTPSDLRTHYLNLLRTIDHAHRSALHTRDRELASLRSRLNEVDQVYRQQLRQREFTIDDLKRRLSYLEEQTVDKVARARHEVEDLWEQRWKERDRHLMERMRRIENGAFKGLQSAVEERDRVWRQREKSLRERFRRERDRWGFGGNNNVAAKKGRVVSSSDDREDDANDDYDDNYLQDTEPEDEREDEDPEIQHSGPSTLPPLHTLTITPTGHNISMLESHGDFGADSDSDTSSSSSSASSWSSSSSSEDESHHGKGSRKFRRRLEKRARKQRRKQEKRERRENRERRRGGGGPGPSRGRGVGGWPEGRRNRSRTRSRGRGRGWGRGS